MIDWDRVATLRAEIGEEDFEEVVPLFLEEVSDITTALESEVDLAALEGNLHCLKGSAMNLGFFEFSNLCHKGEALASKGSAAEVDVPAILDCYAQSKAVFLDGLSI